MRYRHLTGPILRVEEVTSTQDVARGYLEKHYAPSGHVVTVLARYQRSGRGRLGRRWLAPHGSAVLASLAFASTGRPPWEYSLAAAVAVCRAVERFLPVPAAIKWPNDVLLDGGKLAGVLVEAGVSAGRPFVVVGAGINVREAPLKSAACVARYAPGVTVEEVASLFLAELDDLLYRGDTVYAASEFARRLVVPAGCVFDGAVLAGASSGGLVVRWPGRLGQVPFAEAYGRVD